MLGVVSSDMSRVLQLPILKQPTHSRTVLRDLRDKIAQLTTERKILTALPRHPPSSAADGDPYAGYREVLSQKLF